MMKSGTEYPVPTASSKPSSIATGLDGNLSTSDSGAGTTYHSITVRGNDMPGTVGDIGIQPGVTYWFETVTVTRSGVAVDNNDGKCYSVTVPTF
jgi:hypothetical protein